MADMAIRGIPDELHRELKAAAERNHRSLNGEVVARLAASVRPAAVDAMALLERIQRRHRRLGPIDLTDRTLHGPGQSQVGGRRMTGARP